MLVTSTGLSGAELGALFGANQTGWRTGGWAPKETVLLHTTSHLGLKVSRKTDDRWICAKRNIEAAEGAVFIGDKTTTHGQLVFRECERLKKPILRLRYSHRHMSAKKLVWQARIWAAWIVKEDIDHMYVTGGEGAFFEGYVGRLIITTAHEVRHPGVLKNALRSGSVNDVPLSKRQRRARSAGSRW